MKDGHNRFPLKDRNLTLGGFDCVGNATVVGVILGAPTLFERIFVGIGLTVTCIGAERFAALQT